MVPGTQSVIKMALPERILTRVYSKDNFNLTD